MAVETFDGQLTRANVQLAVRSGVLTEAESSRYWQARRRYRTLSDSNSMKTIEKDPNQSSLPTQVFMMIP